VAGPEVERKLAAILATDVVGYSRLMEADEAGTLAAMKAHRRELWTPLTEKYGGRIVGTAGDSLLVEFASAVAAIQCAVAVQRGMAERNSGLPEDKRMELRMGINIGEVVVDGDDIHGEGVNIAARLESLCEPNGVALSGNVYEQIQGKLDESFEDGGAHKVKNITRPIQVWRWSDAPAPEVARATDPALPDKPSIAVLPFNNMSGDPEQEYFADGIAEDIITELSRFHWFLVIARNSSFTYKGGAVDVKQVARELGTRYVVEGSVRKAGNRVRVTAQLIDAETGAHVWAERYDRDLDDIFVVQDEITQNIVAAVAPEFESAEMQRASRAGDRNSSVWELAMQARWHLGKYTKQSCADARRLLLEATALDARNAQAHTLLAMTHWFESIYIWSDSLERSSAEAMQAARRAVSLDSADAMAQAALGLAFIVNQRNDEAVETLNRAVRLNPNLAQAHGWLGIALTLACDFRAAVRAAEQAVKLSPRDLDIPLWMGALSFTALAEGRYEEVIDITNTMLREKPDLPTARRHRAAAFAWMGREAEARSEIDELLRVVPDSTISQVERVYTVKDPEINARWLDGLRKAGLPE
jgi:TolB-like protein/cytochrome c-type biogenesis protein CcmH/NrfG